VLLYTMVEKRGMWLTLKRNDDRLLAAVPAPDLDLVQAVHEHARVDDNDVRLSRDALVRTALSLAMGLALAPRGLGRAVARRALRRPTGAPPASTTSGRLLELLDLVREEGGAERLGHRQLVVADHERRPLRTGERADEIAYMCDDAGRPTLVSAIVGVVGCTCSAREDV
jgi:hypothetical protein